MDDYTKGVMTLPKALAQRDEAELQVSQLLQLIDKMPAFSAEDFACWLIDNCEGMRVTEEDVQQWIADMIRARTTHQSERGRK